MVNRVMQAKILKMRKSRSKIPRALSAEAVRVARYAPSAVPPEIKGRKFDPPDATLMERDVSTSVAVGELKVVGYMDKECKFPIFEQIKFVDKGTPAVYSSQAHAKAWLLKVPVTRKPAMDNAKGSVRRYLEEPKKDGKLAKPDKTFARPEWYDAKEEHDKLKLQEQLEFINNEPTPEQKLMVNWSNWKRQGQTLFVRKNFVDRTGYSLDLWFYGPRVYFIELDYDKGIGRLSRNYQSVNRAIDNMNKIRWVLTVPIKESS